MQLPYADLDQDIATVIVLTVVKSGNSLSWMGCLDYIHIAFARTIMKKGEKLLI